MGKKTIFQYEVCKTMLVANLFRMFMKTVIKETVVCYKRQYSHKQSRIPSTRKQVPGISAQNAHCFHW